MSSQALLPVSDETFAQAVLNSSVPVAVVFHAAWCASCGEFLPRITRIGETFAPKVKVVGVDVEQVPVAPTTYAVRGIPSTLIFVHGEVVERAIGGIDNDSVTTLFAKYS